MTAYLLERAWVDGRVRDDVLVEIDGSRFTSVTPGEDSRCTGDSSTRIPGLTLPGFANTHSHAFHRALRGRAQRDRGSFWTWREQMYRVAGRLDPDGYYALARAVYAEMVAAGYTGVGEFHYLHHQPDGTPYDDPNAMGQALVAAARDVGLRITLLDALYLSSGFGAPLEPAQRRFGDGDAECWRERVDALRRDLQSRPDAVVGAAIHSIRAVPRADLAAFVDFPGPVHAHVSEQPAENDACREAYGATPVEVLAAAGLLGRGFTAVHATHLTASDIGLLDQSHVSFCPTTERDLGDGIGPSRRLHDAGATLTLGSDSHAVIDAFEELRALELHERLASGERGRWTPAELLAAGTTAGHRSLAVPDAGRIEAGQRADLVTVDLHSPRTAGTGGDEHAAVFAAAAADVRQVMVDGAVVFDGDHGAVGRELDRVIGGIWA